MRSRVDMIEQIAQMAEQMKPRFPDAKIKDTHLDLPESAVKFSAAMVREGCDWLISIFENEYEAVRKVRNLLTEEQWDRYNKWGCFDEVQEVLLLKEKMIPFRKALVGRDRPNLFKKGEQREEEKRTKDS